MCCYNLERKIIFIHIPKTGGMSIERILIENYGFKNFRFLGGPYEFLNKNEGTLGFFKYILNHSKESKELDLLSFTKFTFVRNPHTRAISGVRYLNQKISNFPDNVFSFYQRSLTDNFFNVHFNMSQSNCIKDLNDEIKIDYIGKYENFSEDLEHILFDIFKFERKDISKYHIHKSDKKIFDLDEDLIKEIADSIHKEDFERFYS
jgi:hypothetical protein